MDSTLDKPKQLWGTPNLVLHTYLHRRYKTQVDIDRTVYLPTSPGRLLLVNRRNVHSYTLLGCSVSTGGNAVKGSSKLNSLSTSPDSAPLDVLVLFGHAWYVGDNASANGLVAIPQSETLAFL